MFGRRKRCCCDGGGTPGSCTYLSAVGSTGKFRVTIAGFQSVLFGACQDCESRDGTYVIDEIAFNCYWEIGSVFPCADLQGLATPCDVCTVRVRWSVFSTTVRMTVDFIVENGYTYTGTYNTGAASPYDASSFDQTINITTGSPDSCGGTITARVEAI